MVNLHCLEFMSEPVLGLCRFVQSHVESHTFGQSGGTLGMGQSLINICDDIIISKASL